MIAVENGSVLSTDFATELLLSLIIRTTATIAPTTMVRSIVTTVSHMVFWFHPGAGTVLTMILVPSVLGCASSGSTNSASMRLVC